MAAIQISFASLSRTLSLVAVLLMVGVIATGCTAPEEVLQGAQGEYCNGADDDCRSPLRCRDYVCTAMGSAESCVSVCNRLDECGAQVNRCTDACLDATDQWGTEPLEHFVTCFEEDLSCEQLVETDEPYQTCYNELPLSDERAQRCTDFVDAARDCGGDSDRVDAFGKECRIMARTRSEEVWSQSDACAERVDDGVCPDIYECFNETFDLDDPFEANTDLDNSQP